MVERTKMAKLRNHSKGGIWTLALSIASPAFYHRATAFKIVSSAFSWLTSGSRGRQGGSGVRPSWSPWSHSVGLPALGRRTLTTHNTSDYWQGRHAVLVCVLSRGYPTQHSTAQHNTTQHRKFYGTKIAKTPELSGASEQKQLAT